MSSTGKKYRLFAATSGRSPCAFFSSEGGCRNGDNCKFLHVAPGGVGTDDSAPRLASSESSVVSSESEADVNEGSNVIPASSYPKQPASSEQGKKTKKRKATRDAATGDIFAKPKSTKAKTEQETSKKQKSPATKKLASPSVQTPSQRKADDRKLKHTKVIKKATDAPDFRSLSLPIASFTVLGQPNPVPTVHAEPATAATPPAGEVPSLPLPVSTPTGRRWHAAVLKTREHPRYAGSFNFEKSIESDEESGRGSSSDWIKCRPWGDWCASNPQAIAIDCEMCETQDPVTGTTAGKALCRLSVVNAENPSEVLLDSLVKPAWPVVDHRSRINGIRAEHLENVQFTLRHAQAFMLALCSEETVILGHALQNDLVALKMEHHCNVDSSLLFHVKDSSTGAPSLKDLAKSVMQKAMPETHDSVNDARTALSCLEVYLEKNGEVEPIERSERPIRNPLASSQLFVHRIPKKCQGAHLSSMFLSHTFVNPKEIADLEFSGDNGKTLVTFSSPRHARLAFDTLDGDGEPDKSGRMQKKVYLKDGGYVRVRKMIHERGTPGSKTE